MRSELDRTIATMLPEAFTHEFDEELAKNMEKHVYKRLFGKLKFSPYIGTTNLLKIRLIIFDYRKNLKTEYLAQKEAYAEYRSSLTKG